MEKRGFVFLDKDGTIVDNYGYPKVIPSDNLMLSKIIDGLHHIQSKGYGIIILSNQPWISKDKISREEVEKVFERITKKLSYFGIKIEKYYFCPHKTGDNCTCKKPERGMVDKALNDFAIDLEKSFFIGDMESDMILGKRIGAKTIQIRNKNLFEEQRRFWSDYVVDELNEVKNII